MKNLIHALALALSLLIVTTLGACGTTKGTVVTKREFDAVKIDPELLEPNKCPWPVKADTIILNTDLEGSDYILKGYEAWKCSELTRATIKEQSERQASDIEKRKDK